MYLVVMHPIYNAFNTYMAIIVLNKFTDRILRVSCNLSNVFFYFYRRKLAGISDGPKCIRKTRYPENTNI